jgi:hypothetical protein
MNELIIKCPHCDDYVIIEKLNCCIFRHGIFKNTLKQIDPHTSKIECEKYISENLIYGCGKPFIIKKNANLTFTVEICDYI